MNYTYYLGNMYNSYLLLPNFPKINKDNILILDKSIIMFILYQLKISKACLNIFKTTEDVVLTL